MSTSPSLIATIKKKISDLLKIERPWFSKVVKYIVIAFLCILIGFPLYIFTVNINLFGLYGDMPNTREVENPENDLSSELISADGVLLGRYIRFNRSQVTYDDLSEDLVNTLLLSEDHRFMDHAGLDFVAFLRVIKGWITLNPAGGGSTITQQLAKNLYTNNPNKDVDFVIAKMGRYPKRIVEKTKEWIISVDLEKNFTKEEIIAMYLNTSSFGSNAYGIKVAAETYFKKSTDSLNLQESAMLVGMLQNPSFYNPARNPNNATRKRNEVLSKIYGHGYKIKTRQQYDSIIALPIELQYRVQNQNTGLAPYFRTVITNRLMQICKEKGIDLWNSGLRIYTTIDSRLQKYAEEAVDEHMRTLQGQFEKEWNGRNPWVDDETNKEIVGYINAEVRQLPYYKELIEKYGSKSDSIKILINLKKPMTVFSWKGERDTLFSTWDSLNYYKRFLQTGFMSMDPSTGHIKAWVGGVNHKFFKFDHVRQGKRQPGSTFKPFVYGLAMESGYSPCQPMLDISPSVKVSGTTWNPPNSSPPYYGSGETYTLRQAMARSLNSISAQMIMALGPVNVVEFAHRVGITSPLDSVPSLCLGVSDVSLYEMVGAYSTYVNSGIYTEPFFITRIEDKNGNVIENFVPKTRQSINDQTAYKMVYMLRGGVEEEGGTSGGINRELRTVDNEIGGKTGTTNNASDGWYVGITHNLVSGGWVGGDERSIRFPSWNFGAGGKSARPIWEKYMLKVYADKTTGIEKGQFKRPASGLDISLDCNRYITESGDTLQSEIKPFDIN
jgi:penicillin-binding protein 1A